MIYAVVPSRTDQYLVKLLRSFEDSEPGTIEHLVVADNGLSPEFRKRWPCTFVPALTPFCFAQAINLAVSKIPPDAHLLVINDDARMVTPSWQARAEALFRSPVLEKYGLISCAIQGGVGNPEQQHVFWDTPAVVESAKTLCFVAVLIQRQAWDAVGPLDERFIAYGHDDDDYCHRMRLAGWQCGVTQRIVVTHGADDRPHSSSYMRYHGQEEMDRMFHENQRIYIEKWGGPPGHEKPDS